MSTILLEQQGSDGTGQRNGFTLAGSWWSEADIDVRKSTAHSFGG